MSGFTLEKEMKIVVDENEQLQAENALLRRYLDKISSELMKEQLQDLQRMEDLVTDALNSTSQTAKIQAVLDAASELVRVPNNQTAENFIKAVREYKEK